MSDTTPAEMVLHPLSEIQELDELVHLLGIEDSMQTPCERVRELLAEMESLRVPAGYIIVPKEPTETQKQKGREQMPVEVDYWVENGLLHAEMRDLKDCVPPENVYRAMTEAHKDTGA